MNSLNIILDLALVAVAVGLPLYGWLALRDRTPRDVQRAVCRCGRKATEMGRLCGRCWNALLRNNMDWREREQMRERGIERDYERRAM